MNKPKNHKLKKTRKPSRNNELRRHSANKKAGRRVLIVTEGQTEEEYFKALRNWKRLHGLIVVIKPNCTDPVSLYNVAKELKEQEQEKSKTGNITLPYDEVWIVYDLEKPNSERREQSKKVEEKVKSPNKIYVAKSDPSFEFWYILHFEKTTKSFTGADEAEQHLKKHHWKDYRKAITPTQNILDKTDTAVENAIWVRKQLESSNSTEPVTDIDKLVAVILPVS
jgi:hypothetical protein